MDLQVLSTTSRTAQSQTGSQEVRGFESLRLHPKVLVTVGVQLLRLSQGRRECSQL